MNGLPWQLDKLSQPHPKFATAAQVAYEAIELNESVLIPESRTVTPLQFLAPKPLISAARKQSGIRPFSAPPRPPPPPPRYASEAAAPLTGGFAGSRFRVSSMSSVPSTPIAS